MSIRCHGRPGSGMPASTFWIATDPWSRPLKGSAPWTEAADEPCHAQNPLLSRCSWCELHRSTTVQVWLTSTETSGPLLKSQAAQHRTQAPGRDLHQQLPCQHCPGAWSLPGSASRHALLLLLMMQLSPCSAPRLIVMLQRGADACSWSGLGLGADGRP